MTAHCPGCRCDEYAETKPQPAVSTEWARRAALDAAAQAVRAAKESRKKPAQ